MPSQPASEGAGSDRPLADLFLEPLAGGARLRVGVIVGDGRLSNVAAGIAHDIRRCGFADLCLVLDGPGGDASATTDRAGRGRPWDRRIAWRAYVAADRYRMRSRPDPHAPARGPSPLEGVPRIRLRSTRDQPGSPDAASLASIRAADLDVLLDLGVGDAITDLGPLARSGAWRLTPSGAHEGEPAFVASMRRRMPTIAVDLECRRSRVDDLLILARVVVATDLVSHARNDAHALFGATHLVIRTLRLLHDRGWPAVEDEAVERRPPDTAPSPLGGPPGDGALLRWLVPLVIERGVARVDRVARPGVTERWRIAIRDPARPIEPGGGAPDLAGFRWIEPPPGHFHADPFVVQDGDRTWLFFEDYVRRWGKGVIACAEVRHGALVGRPRTVLTGRGHLSYPCVFAHDGAWYMVPESAGERRVRLLRAITFPWTWEHVAVLHHGRAVDTTVWHQDGRWWFFTTLREPRGNAMALMLFRADQLDGPWIAHPANPISSDIRWVRGAGSIAVLDGRLIRPSQDGSVSYGRSVTFHEIIRLTPTEYVERPIGGLDPGHDPQLAGIHTYNRAGTVEVIDGRASPRASWSPGRLAMPAS